MTVTVVISKESYEVVLPAGWKRVGLNPYNPITVKANDKFLDVVQLLKGKTVWRKVERKLVGCKSVVFLLLIRKKVVK